MFSFVIRDPLGRDICTLLHDKTIYCYQYQIQRKDNLINKNGG